MCITRFFKKHWEGWGDQPLPALKGKTPAEAVATTEGRAAVEALLKDAEQLAANDKFMGINALDAIGRARKKLGLA